MSARAGIIEIYDKVLDSSARFEYRVGWKKVVPVRDGQRSRKRGCGETRCAPFHDHTRGNVPRRAFPYFYRRRALGFFEYSINVRKSYITSGECTRYEGTERASHATDYFFPRPFVLHRVNEPLRRGPWVRPVPTALTCLPPGPDSSSPFPVFVYLNFNVESPPR